MKPPITRSPGHSPALAAFLSFVWPGLGQGLVAGQRRAAALFGAPAVLALLLLAYGLARGSVVFAAQLFADRDIGLAAVVIVLLLGVLRLAAVVHAFLGGEQRETRKRLDRAVLVALVAVIVVSHLGSGYLLLAYSNAGAQMFGDPARNSLIDLAPGTSLAPGQTPGSLPTPVAGGRVTILFTGISAGENLYDSIMVVSYDPKANSVQMISVPRDSANFPLYFGGVYSAKINSLARYVSTGVIRSPDSPYLTLVKEIGYLVGVPINYYAAMNVDGFVQMIDMVGGIDVVNPNPIADGTYDWLDGVNYGFYLSVGPHHLDGKHALAYVRSRHTVGDYDWGRASRQQEVLVDLLHKMAQPSQILNLPKLISTLGSSVTTDFPSNRVADFVAAGQSVPKGNMKQVVLGPPYSIPFANDPYFRYCLINAKVAELSIQWFGHDSTWYGKPTPANTCP